MLSAFASALLLAASQDGCVDHSAYDFDLAGARLREVEIVHSEPAGRSETGRFPDGTLVTVSADYCTDPVITMAVDAPLDAQNQMRLGQLMGRLDIIAGCTTNDWAAHDASLAAAAADLDLAQTRTGKIEVVCGMVDAAVLGGGEKQGAGEGRKHGNLGGLK